MTYQQLSEVIHQVYGFVTIPSTFYVELPTDAYRHFQAHMQEIMQSAFKIKFDLEEFGTELQDGMGLVITTVRVPGGFDLRVCEGPAFIIRKE